MDWTLMYKRRCMRRAPVPLVSRLARADIAWIVIIGWMLTGLLLLPVFAAAIPDGEAEVALDPERQGILQAHPEWPPEVRAAVLAGIICPGMSPDMVRAAWGSPTRTSTSGGPVQHETWYYEGRPRAVERLNGRGTHEDGAREWTVSFSDGRVVGWTD
jgi:hypothetical protein